MGDFSLSADEKASDHSFALAIIEIGSYNRILTLTWDEGYRVRGGRGDLTNYRRRRVRRWAENVHRSVHRGDKSAQENRRLSICRQYLPTSNCPIYVRGGQPLSMFCVEFVEI